MSHIECAYCFHDVSSVGSHEPPPALDDDDGWAALAREHAEDCEWILTRAHRQEVPRCIAPISDDTDPRLCGEPAVTTREVEGVTCALCAKHAVEVDATELPDPHTPSGTRRPVLSYWEDEGAQEIANKLAPHMGAGGDVLKAIRSEIESWFEACDEIDVYEQHDVDWTVAGVALKLWDMGEMRRKDAESALGAVNWDLARLDAEPEQK